MGLEEELEPQEAQSEVNDKPEEVQQQQNSQGPCAIEDETVEEACQPTEESQECNEPAVVEETVVQETVEHETVEQETVEQEEPERVASVAQSESPAERQANEQNVEPS